MADSISVDKWLDFWKYYEGLSNQELAVRELFENIPTSLKLEGSSWIAQYREPEPEPEVPDLSNPLQVPYQSQRDNASGTGYRECFSSSCAMVAMYWGKIENDDAYNKVREQFGDSTDAQAQVRALRSLGLAAEFKTCGTVDDLKHQINVGRPTPVGWLHKGALPGTGGGHYCVIRGYDQSGFWYVNDPYGDCDLVNGGYPGSTNGDNLHYSFKNWNPRWEVDGPGTGWYVDIWDPTVKK